MSQNILTIDVEEYFEEASAEVASRCDSRIEAQIDKCLHLLSETSNKATFFFLARIARQFPALPRKVLDEGHEVGCHGYEHVYFNTMAMSKQREELTRSVRQIEDVTGKKVLGFRAPYFSINRRNRELLLHLAQEGLEYDSSIFPGFHPYYGWRNTEPDPYRITFGSKTQLIEIPPSTFGKLGFRTGVAGGGYLRIYPFTLTSSILKSREKQGRPLVVYFHPWELDPDQPKLKLRLSFPLRHYFNLRTTERRLKKILSEYRFSPCNTLLNTELKEVKFEDMRLL